MKRVWFLREAWNFRSHPDRNHGERERMPHEGDCSPEATHGNSRDDAPSVENWQAQGRSRCPSYKFFNRLLPDTGVCYLRIRLRSSVTWLHLSLNRTSSMNARISISPRPHGRSRFSGSVGSGSLEGSK